MKMTVIPIVFGALGPIPRGLVKRLEDLEIRVKVETIQTAALLGSAWIMWKVLETCCHSEIRENASANAGEKNSQMSK